MLGNFWQGAGGSVAEKLTGEGVSRLFGAATLFWGVGLAAWLSAHGGWATVWDIYGKLKGEEYVVDLIAFGMSLYFLLALSQLVMEWLTLPLLRLVEGYWVWPLDKLTALWVKYWVKRRWQQKHTRWNSLATAHPNLSPSEQAEFYRLESDLANYPLNHDNFMPTAVGNSLRVAEEYSHVRYGLEAITVWPHLWLVMPESAQQELEAARQSLDDTARTLGWGLLMLLWIYWHSGVLLIAVLVSGLAYWRMCQAADFYGALIRAAFDLYRFDLYRQFHWPAPTVTNAEPSSGKLLTQYIYRGGATLSSPVTFI